MADEKNTLPDRKEKVDSKKEDGLEVLDVPGSNVTVKRVDTKAKSYSQLQDEALLHYKVTGEVGTYIDPGRTQEPDIAPEYGVSPHPELFNPAPPESTQNAGFADAADTNLTDSVEDKNKADDPSVAQGLTASR